MKRVCSSCSACSVYPRTVFDRRIYGLIRKLAHRYMIGKYERIVCKTPMKWFWYIFKSRVWNAVQNFWKIFSFTIAWKEGQIRVQRARFTLEPCLIGISGIFGNFSIFNIEILKKGTSLLSRHFWHFLTIGLSYQKDKDSVGISSTSSFDTAIEARSSSSFSILEKNSKFFKWP